MPNNLAAARCSLLDTAPQKQASHIHPTQGYHTRRASGGFAYGRDICSKQLPKPEICSLQKLDTCKLLSSVSQQNRVKSSAKGPSHSASSCHHCCLAFSFRPRTLSLMVVDGLVLTACTCRFPSFKILNREGAVRSHFPLALPIDTLRGLLFHLLPPLELVTRSTSRFFSQVQIHGLPPIMLYF